MAVRVREVSMKPAAKTMVNFVKKLLPPVVRCTVNFRLLGG